MSFIGGVSAGALPDMCSLGMCRMRDPHFQPLISGPEHIIFTDDKIFRSGASPF